MIALCPSLELCRGFLKPAALEYQVVWPHVTRAAVTLSISVSALQHFLIFYFNYYIVRSDGSHLQIYPHYGKHLTLCLGYDGNALQVGYYCLETRIFALQDG